MGVLGDATSRLRPGDLLCGFLLVVVVPCFMGDGCSDVKSLLFVVRTEGGEGGKRGAVSSSPRAFRGCRIDAAPASLRHAEKDNSKTKRKVTAATVPRPKKEHSSLSLNPSRKDQASAGR